METAGTLNRARYKLRQADLLLSHLRGVSEEIALERRRAGSGHDYRLPLDTFFFACLGAAQSVFYIVDKSRAPNFKAAIAKWKRTALDEGGRARFNKMMDLRGRDVHYGEVTGEALAKMIEMKDTGSMYGQHYNAALFGPQPLTEHVNPDGEPVRARALQGSVGLYVDIAGARYEATTVCAHFLDQLRDMIRAAEASVPKESTAAAVSPSDEA
jgi:hypothetical protein